ncbi:Lipoyltransferase and lipoate-protein ligase [Auricularia subglabra TFB-10046 SS5]|nr:Lipoyltransferase and lipoate-protein ligase [Auricularia subglabra TFB-10046 SS5]
MTRATCALSTIARLGVGSWPAQILVSKSMAPFLNLALEDWLLKNAEPELPSLLVYRNEPSVIIGRNQNPWKEVNLRAREARGIWLARRRSGGGTVYHDAGNSNYSIHLPRTSFDRARTGRVVERAVRDILGVSNARMNARNDLVVIDDAGQELKVSGSAYKIAGKRAYHHGTMLLESALEDLGEVLRNDKARLVTKGVESVRAPVTKLHLWNRNATHDNFVNAMVQSFNEEFDTHAEVSEELEVRCSLTMPATRRSLAFWQSWDWIYGQTPEFTHSLAHDFAWGKVAVQIHSKHGVVLDTTFEGIDLPSLEGQRYAALELDPSLLDDRQLEVVRWLESAM